VQSGAATIPQRDHCGSGKASLGGKLGVSHARATIAKVDVLLVSYNHTEFIAQALESILRQQAAFRYRIIVADDFSTDDTVAKIRNYADLNPDIEFVFLESPQRLGITKNYERAFKAATAEYVAILEGDDYWASSQKLAKQVAALDEHIACPMCGSNFLILDAEQSMFSLRTEQKKGCSILFSVDQVADNVVANFSTCVYRRSALMALPPAVFEMKSYDWIINLCVGKNGPLAYVHEPLSVYRRHAGAAWSSQSRVQDLTERLELIPVYDVVTNGSYQKEFEALAVGLRRRLRYQKLAPTRRLSSIAIKKYCPPVVILIVRYLLPPVVYRFLVGTLR
jgi:glycosyltransferase involved in cell wall biosynthesis